MFGCSHRLVLKDSACEEEKMKAYLDGLRNSEYQYTSRELEVYADMRRTERNVAKIKNAKIIFKDNGLFYGFKYCPEDNLEIIVSSGVKNVIFKSNFASDCIKD